MRNIFSLNNSMLNQMTDSFTIERNGNTVCSAHGFFCGKDYPSTIQLVENVDIQDGDWLIHTPTKRKYYAVECTPISMEGEVLDWMVKYLSESQYQEKQNAPASTNININTVNGPSIIGSQHNATINVGNSLDDIHNLLLKLPACDQESAGELFEELKRVEESNHPILVEGALSKFSDLIQKHSDLIIAIGGWAVKLLIGQ